MDHRSAIRLIEEIELRLAFLGVDLDEAVAEASGRTRARRPYRRVAGNDRGPTPLNTTLTLG